MTINGHFSILSTHFCLDTTLLGSTFKLSYLNLLIISLLIKRFQCIMSVCLCVEGEVDTAVKGSIFLKNRHIFIIQEMFDKLIYGINTVIKCGT